MNTDKHTVTIPIDDYNRMLDANKKYERLSKSYDKLKTAIDDRLNDIELCRVSIDGLDLSAEHQVAEYRVGSTGDIIIKFTTTSPC